MALKKKPVTGMKDILPAEMEIRDYVLGKIKETYRGFGFSAIETPCVEHIENLTSKQGGDNEKLIFKILKRGEKLNLETAKEEADLVDGGLRYDLTLPLSRYYSNNSANLPSPFKALQVGSVWRADRPQKGRFRQFVQCDIDILGDATSLAAELLERGYAAESVEKYKALLDSVKTDADGVRALGETLKGVLKEGTAEGLAEIMETVSSIAEVKFGIEFDPTLVRGMGYYTGTIFEVSMEGFGGSVAGGGRYDKMIGKFTGMDTPACGFSIGFERIVTILLDNGFKVPAAAGKKAYLFEKNIGAEKLAQVLKEASEERKAGVQVLVAQMNKNKKFQKEQLQKDGYTEFKEYYREGLK